MNKLIKHEVWKLFLKYTIFNAKNIIYILKMLKYIMIKLVNPLKIGLFNQFIDPVK